MNPPAALEWCDVSVARGNNPVVRGVSLTVPHGAWLAILGPNGAGKTSLVRTLTSGAGRTGTVLVNGRDIDALAIAERARAIALVPQHPVIPPGLCVFDYVLLGRTPHYGLRYAASASDRSKTLAVMQRLEIDGFAARAIDSLSGGERQRAVLARALVQEAPILVLDEPTTFLDVGHQLDVLELVAELRRERDVTVVTTMHDLALAGQFAECVAILHEGRLVGAGDPDAVLTPACIAATWGVDATTEVGDSGLVITIRRRRESKTELSPRDRT